MHSLTKILHSLLTGGHDRAVKQMEEEDDGRKEVTSIRLKPQTRAYLQAQSEALGISVSQFINIIVDGVVNIETSPHQSRIDTMYDRLMLLFESHGIEPLQMSRMLTGHGFTLSKLKSRDATLDLITPELLATVSSWFGVQTSWLSAKSNAVYPTRSLHWYKCPESMAAAVIERNIRYGELDVYAVKNAGVDFKIAEEHDDNEHHLGMGFLLRYRNRAGDSSVSRYEFCEFQRWNYEKCRADLKLVFRFLSELASRKGGIRFHGCSVDEAIFDRIYHGRILPDQLEKALNRAEWWDPRSVLGKSSAHYREMKFGQYVTAYCGTPGKTFEPVYNQYSSYPEGWRVSLWNGGQGEEQYFSLSAALEDSFNRYHSSADDPADRNDDGRTCSAAEQDK
ncbi:conjugal transfer protein TraE [Serratia sp. PF2-63]|uniref:conjugal transfer protein TraE n=1 Tax=Enterobacterales TaxID=91347 RepID=UPI0024B5EBC1|nr:MULTISPECIES: conjugal transfer protein TraE [Enterobacterales]MDI9223615.1 conjugal transfer protein TraE [Pantoea sp. EA-12]MDI9265912.1 conjugal transfer protein TraE [Serratia sp. PF2-63]MDI9267120.1 conjugal transfer protein TraE [Serratia sp. PF-27]